MREQAAGDADHWVSIVSAALVTKTDVIEDLPVIVKVCMQHTKLWRRHAEKEGEKAAEDWRAGHYSSAQDGFVRAFKIARCAVVFERLMGYTLPLLAETSFALAVGDTAKVDGNAVSDARSDEAR